MAAHASDRRTRFFARNYNIHWNFLLRLKIKGDEEKMSQTQSDLVFSVQADLGASEADFVGFGGPCCTPSSRVHHMTLATTRLHAVSRLIYDLDLLSVLRSDWSRDCDSCGLHQSQFTDES